MTKKDYELIATVVRQFKPEVKEKMARLFAGQFFAAGYKFDKQKFLTACGIGYDVKGELEIATKDEQLA